MIDMDLQPRLEGDGVTLAPLVEGDWAALYAVASDPRIWAGHPASDRWKEPVFRRFFEQALSSGGALAARDAATGGLIGSSRYDVERAGANEIEIGWTFLAVARWGGQVNPAMKRLMIGHALRSFDRVIFLIGERNGRSRAAIEKIGAVLTDRVHDAAMGDTMVRHVVYAIDQATFSSGPLSRGSIALADRAAATA